MLIGIGHDEAAGVELARGLPDVLAVRCEIAVTRDVHWPGIGFCFAMDHPLRQRFTDTAALQKTGHHAAGQPVIGQAGDRAHQRIAVGREGKGPIDPIFDADIVQHRVAVECHFQLVGNAVGVLLDQFDTVVPGGAVDVPVLVVDLVNAH